LNLTFHSPAFLWLLAALPVVVLLHYLRARRLRHEVSALFLWDRATRAASRRRRIRPSWLLFVQLLFTALAAFALARPAVVSRRAPDVVVIIDASASMRAAATASAVGDDRATTRLDLATDLALELGQGAGRVALVRAGTVARLLAPLEATQSERREAIAGLEAGDASADIGGALELTGALLPGADVHVVTDMEMSLGRATVHVVGEPVTNLGISALEIGIGQVFIGVVSSGPQPAQTRVVLSRDGVELASAEVLVPAGGVGSATFPLPDLSGVIQARLDGPSDALAIDDVAFVGSRPLQVVTDDTQGAVTRALSAVPNTQVTYSRGAGLLDAEVVVLTGGGVPSTQAPYVSFAAPSPEPVYTVVRDFARAHPLLRFADLSDVVVGLDPQLEPWPEEAGWRVLARTTDLTPIIRVRESGGPLALEFAFNPSQSDLTLRPAFPALLANVVGELRSTTRLRLGEAAGAAGPWTEPGAYPAEDGTLTLASLLSANESRLPVSGGESVLRAAGSAQAAPANTAVAANEGTVGPDVAPSGSAPTFGAVVLCALALAALLAEWVLRRTRFAGS